MLPRRDQLQPSQVVVIPTYNESGTVITVVDRVFRSDGAWDVLVVDDDSPDGTAELVKAHEEWGGRLHLLVRPGKSGLGSAYREGFAWALAAGYDVIAQMDADGSHPPETLAAMRSVVLSGADLVLASRYVPGASVDRAWSRERMLLSRAGNLYARALLGLPYRDLTGGYKAWRSSLLRAIDLQGCGAAGFGFQIQTTLAAHRAGATVEEVPFHFHQRLAGDSSMSAGIVLEALMAVPAMRRGHRLDGSSLGPDRLDLPALVGLGVDGQDAASATRGRETQQRQPSRVRPGPLHPRSRESAWHL